MLRFQNSCKNSQPPISNKTNKNHCFPSTNNSVATACTKDTPGTLSILAFLLQRHQPTRTDATVGETESSQVTQPVTADPGLEPGPDDSVSALNHIPVPWLHSQSDFCRPLSITSCLGCPWAEKAGLEILSPSWGKEPWKETSGLSKHLMPGYLPLSTSVLLTRSPDFPSHGFLTSWSFPTICGVLNENQNQVSGVVQMLVI